MVARFWETLDSKSTFWKEISGISGWEWSHKMLSSEVMPSQNYGWTWRWRGWDLQKTVLFFVLPDSFGWMVRSALLRLEVRQYLSWKLGKFYCVCMCFWLVTVEMSLSLSLLSLSLSVSLNLSWSINTFVLCNVLVASQEWGLWSWSIEPWGNRIWLSLMGRPCHRNLLWVFRSAGSWLIPHLFVALRHWQVDERWSDDVWPLLSTRQGHL